MNIPTLSLNKVNLTIEKRSGCGLHHDKIDREREVLPVPEALNLNIPWECLDCRANFLLAIQILISAVLIFFITPVV